MTLLGERPSEIVILEQAHARRGELIRAVGDEQLLPVARVETFAAERGRDHRYTARERLENLDACSPSRAQRHDHGHRRREHGVELRHRTEDFDAGKRAPSARGVVVTSDELEARVRKGCADERQDLAREVRGSIGVGWIREQPDHGEDGICGRHTSRGSSG